MKKKIVPKALLAAALGAAILAVPVTAEEGGVDYILLVPSFLNVEAYDEGHLSEEYSTDDYKILFYKEGERVLLNTDYDGTFTVKNSATLEDFSDYTLMPNGSVVLTMPAMDLYFDVAEAPAETDTRSGEAAEGEGQAEAEAETEPATEAQTEPQTEAPDGHNEESRMNVNMLTGGMKATIEMVNGTRANVSGIGDFNTPDNIAFITVTADDPADTIEMIVKKNDYRVEDVSQVLSTNMISGDGVLKADVKDVLDVSSGDRYTFKFRIPGKEGQPQAAPAEGGEGGAEVQTEPETEPPIEEIPVNEVLSVATKTLNVRESPDPDSEKIAELNGGDTVQVISRYTGAESDWVRIVFKYDGRDVVGYVNSGFLE